MNTEIKQFPYPKGFELWWDKYKVTLADIDQACTAADQRIKDYLAELGYAGS